MIIVLKLVVIPMFSEFIRYLVSVIKSINECVKKRRNSDEA